MKISHTPSPGCLRMTCLRPSHRLKSPLTEYRREPVRVLDLSFSVLLPRYPEPVGHPLPDGDGTGEESGRVYGFQLAQSIAAVGDDLHGARAGQEGPYHEAAIPCGVHPEE